MTSMAPSRFAEKGGEGQSPQTETQPPRTLEVKRTFECDHILVHEEGQLKSRQDTGAAGSCTPQKQPPARTAHSAETVMSVLLRFAAGMFPKLY